MLSSLSFLYYMAWPTVSSFLTSLFSGFSRVLYLRAAHLDCESLVEGGGHADNADSEENATSAADAHNPVAEYPKEITYIRVSSHRTKEAHIQNWLARPDSPDQRPCEVVYVAQGEYLASGGTAFVERLPSGNVIKTPIPNPYCPPEERDNRRNMFLEAKVYERIGQHPCIPTVVNWDPETCCLVLEYLENGTLKNYIRQHPGTILLQTRLKWAKQAAGAVAVLHSANVVHCDISPRNFLLTSDLDLKISDFGGSSLCGTEPSASPETRFCPPGYDFDAPPVYGDDIFSLGSVIYFIMTHYYPYEDLSSDEVEKHYAVREFPDLSSVVAGAIIKQCWERQVETAKEVYDYLTTVRSDDIC